MANERVFSFPSLLPVDCAETIVTEKKRLIIIIMFFINLIFDQPDMINRTRRVVR